jgi:hypothetical protein
VGSWVMFKDSVPCKLWSSLSRQSVCLGFWIFNVICSFILRYFKIWCLCFLSTLIVAFQSLYSFPKELLIWTLFLWVPFILG